MKTPTPQILRPKGRILLPKRVRQNGSYGHWDVEETDGLYSIIDNPLFDYDCADNNLVSLSLAGVNQFLDWLGWMPSNVIRLVRSFIIYNRAKYSNCEKSKGWITDPCEDGNGVESLFASLAIEGFGRLRRTGPVRDTTNVALNYCETSPRFHIDGALITDDTEYDLVRIVEVLIQDLLSMAVTGNKSDPGQFDGLEQLVVDSYSNAILNSIVVDWSGNDMGGGGGETWNGGQTIDSAWSFVDLLMALVRRIKQRVALVPNIRASAFGLGDMVLTMPGSFATCLLDAYTCWSVCAGDFSLMMSFDARRFRDALNGGAFGAGTIMIEGMPIPILPNDELINADGSFDAYLLTRGVGPWKWLYGQFLDMGPVATLTADKTGMEYSAIDGGRILQWARGKNTCLEQSAEMQPRIVCEAPWAQVRISDIKCDTVLGPISGDPNSYYFPYYYDCGPDGM